LHLPFLKEEVFWVPQPVRFFKGGGFSGTPPLDFVFSITDFQRPVNTPEKTKEDGRTHEKKTPIHNKLCGSGSPLTNKGFDNQCGF